MRRHFLLAAAALTCPCHLPLLAVLLAGTVVGTLLADNLVVLFLLFGLLFGGSLSLWSRQTTAMPTTASAIGLDSGPSRPPVGEAEPVRVQILQTPGCASCAGVERSWAALRPEYGDRVQVELADLLEHPDLARQYGVLRTPAVVIDGRLRAQGTVDAARLRLLLDEALRERTACVGATEGMHA